MRQSGTGRRVAGPSGFAAGTIMLFYQTAAPTGWTRDTSTAAANDAALRVMTSGTWVASYAGSNAASALFETAGAVASQDDAGGSPSHTHTMSTTNKVGSGATASEVYPPSGSNADTADGVYNTGGPSGGTAAHSHDMEFDMKYIDVILASKD